MAMTYRAEITAKEQLSEALALKEFEYIYAPMEFLCAETPDKSLIIAVPPLFIGGNEPAITEKLQKSGVTRVLAHTLGHIELIKNEAGFSGTLDEVMFKEIMEEYTK